MTTGWSYVRTTVPLSRLERAVEAGWHRVGEDTLPAGQRYAEEQAIVEWGGAIGEAPVEGLA